METPTAGTAATRPIAVRTAQHSTASLMEPGVSTMFALALAIVLNDSLLLADC